MRDTAGRSGCQSPCGHWGSCSLYAGWWQSLSRYCLPGARLYVYFHNRRSIMGRIAFVTDSVAGIPADQVEKYDITVVPLQVIFGTESFRDGIDLTQDQFFERLKAA